MWLFKCLSVVVFLFLLPHFSVGHLRTIKGVILVQLFLLAPVFRLSLLLPLVFNVLSILNSILKQTRPLSLHASFQPVLLKLLGDKEEIAIAKEIEKDFKYSSSVRPLMG